MFLPVDINPIDTKENTFYSTIYVKPVFILSYRNAFSHLGKPETKIMVVIHWKNIAVYINGERYIISKFYILPYNQSYNLYLQNHYSL